ncbi:hypothetical protein EJJ20_29835 [Pseudomonas poae]|nr:hypothetical protein EJJ20_29835 [Pseudomonas poae]
MSKGVVIKYECGACNEQHDDEDGARECCMPSVTEMYICPICDEQHDEMEDAEKCILGHADIESTDDQHCPNCLRPSDTAQLMIEVAIAGHCSVCNPIYTPDENLRIKYALEPKDL